ncbi:TPA: valine--tRNA ligase [Candidatus Dependentiae bacterium]|nr:MAG: Valine-tRNA ligase [candidate division TM6 bacterium GW2011_GWF2_36_131]KKQ03562.1 MAG: Valine-tRNA ligase [candidate division TM6 bacterium GW2011_GWE2_36_25]KKQ20162.1 MAG: Valine-tRNA ligase [candidate division TM6 bacterium GW2011_GWA2_36_9]HBR70704.1 valine--tRNA ligase [Candidatus Dependentiae bacterium]HCU00324.1 valine--tRNA ligase [Candidatus Dependentiae bacterium]
MDKTYTYQTAEQEIKELWEKEKIYTFNPDGKKIFSIDTPPPTVSGSLHLGHIFSYTHADIIARFNRMKGFEVFYPFGFDDNGLPTERYVEKKRKVSPFGVGRSEFIKICLEETAEAEQKFKNLWQAVGLSVDWKLWYSTISTNVRKISQESFIKLYEKGFIYRKNEPALYCPQCRTSVAQAELDDQDIETTFNDIVFITSKGEKLIISTTRPELLASCVALFYHPKDKRYQHLRGQKAIVPLYEYEVPIFADEKVDQEKGSGLVMCCTFGDKTDIQWYQQHKLPYRESIGRDGKWTKITGPLEGLKVIEARKQMIELLKEKGLLVNQKNIHHAVNIHERCKHAIEYIILPQWFLNILENKKEFLAAADKIEWYPTYMKSRYINWVENLNWDWCLSRQRFYGIPFPVWYCKACDEVLLPEINDLPVDPQETQYPEKCPKCKSTDIVPDTDIMDTWNTSSLTPYICASLLDKNRDVFSQEITKTFFPMSMRPQAHDIIRTWAFYTIVKTTLHNNIIPWNSIVISGHVLSSTSEKISKSQKHSIPAPEKLLEQWSADAIRFWTASATLGTDVAFSEPQLKIGQRLVTKLWNAFRFMHQHVENFTPQDEKVQCDPVNEWILHKMSETFNAFEKELNKKEFSLALNRIDSFFWNDFCDNYLELIKNRLFNPDQYDQQEIESTKEALYWVGLRILQLYAPFLPFITEQLYQHLYRKHLNAASIHCTNFNEIQKDFTFTQSAQEIEQIIDIVARVRKIKTTGQLSLGTPITTLTICTQQEDLPVLIQKHLQLLKGITRAEDIVLSTKMEEDSVQKEENNYSMIINL